jgi:uncharacterized membrane protein
MNELGYNAWRLVSLSPLSPTVLGLLGLALAVGVALAGRGLRRERDGWRRATLVALRALAALCVLFMLLEPGVRLLQTTRVKTRLALLVDRSASMSFPAGPTGPTRAEAVTKYFAAALEGWKALSDRFIVEPALFDREATSVDLPRLAQPLDPKGPRTDLLAAIRTAVEGGGARRLSGIVLVTDGADNAALTSGLPAEVKAELKGLGVPISSLVVGEAGLKDIAVEKVSVDDFAFVRNTAAVEAEIFAKGFAGQQVPVVLKREGKVVATEEVMLEPGTERYPVKFTFMPDEIGQFVYTVSVPVLEGEAITSNNTRSFVLKVIRDRMRVMLVVGRPSWDERFVRALLKQDPNVDLVSFFILRTNLNNVHARDDELSLIPFPAQEIFDEQLHTFDVVVFLNFAHKDRSYHMDQYLPGMADYVRSGGAFIMVGGENSFGDGHYEETALAEVLPVEFDATPAAAEPFKARLTPEGARHPVTQVLPGLEANAGVFAHLPPLPGMNVTRARAGAQVLIDNPSLMVDGKGAPVLALGEFGSGRSMALTVDGLWSWTLPAAAGGTPARVYDRIWSQALRWLVRDPDLTTLRIVADHPSVEPGEPEGAVVTLRKADYGPAAGAKVQVELVQVDEGKTVLRQEVTTTADGTAHVDLGTLPPGPYKVVARVHKDGEPDSEASDAIAVRAQGPERSDASAHTALLQEIADATGGVVKALPTSGVPDLPLTEPEVVEVGARKDRPLWDNAWPLVALVLTLGVEWALRRRWGHL